MAEQRLIPKIGSKVSLKDYDPSYTGSVDKDRAMEDDQKLEKRLADSPEAERAAALDQIYRIARFRLESTLTCTPS